MNPCSNFEFGPLLVEALTNAYLDGKIDTDALIKNDEMEEWLELSDFTSLYDLIKQCEMDSTVSELKGRIQRFEKLRDEHQKTVKPKEQIQWVNDLLAEHSVVNVLLSFGFNHIDPIKFEELILRVFESLLFK